jgi:hypothetical protein
MKEVTSFSEVAEVLEEVPRRLHSLQRFRRLQRLEVQRLQILWVADKFNKLSDVFSASITSTFNVFLGKFQLVC